MKFDLRQFLTRHRIPWKDHGPNCSRNFVNIHCVFCGVNDPSYHLRIHETAFWWYCLKAPSQKGRNLDYLLYKLGIKNVGNELDGIKSSDELKQSDDERLSQRKYSLFDSALTLEATNYLKSRGFSFPTEVVKKFDLRVAPYGKWACRLLFPLTVGWTGRSMRKDIDPKYLSETDSSGYLKIGEGSSVLICEGPFDAIRVAAITNDFTVLAMTGGRISPSMLQQLRVTPGSIYYVPDSDVSPSQVQFNLQELRMNCIRNQVKHVKLFPGVKDLGEMSELDTIQWLKSFS